jgi:polyribonucleotide nucleotidyltransferase
VAEVGKPAWEWEAPVSDMALAEAVTEAAQGGMSDAYRISNKQDRQAAVRAVKDATVQSIAQEGDDARWTAADVQAALAKLEKETVRKRVIAGEPRIDGRDRSTVRPISVKVGVLPRTHGSAVFTRGETQAIVATTLGTGRDAQIIDALEGEYKEPFMLHYNFPPYCVGETGFIGSPKRREIGHGKLARRGIQAVMPSNEQFGYVIRVVSEITESNGSSSMASVCGTSLALMDAGVPIKAPVAGVAMGLVKEKDKFAVLTDILGDEDHLGDMDFKVAGTEEGVTALQMDIKIQGITREIMDIALAQAKEARLHILGEMAKVISRPREKMSEWAPTIMTIKIDPEKIRDVIGKGGAVIRAITEETGATVDIDNDGTVRIASVDGASGKEARRRIELITADVEVGRIYEGKVARLMDFGAFVTILQGKDGLVHISQISNERVEKVSDKLAEGDVVKVKVLEVDRQGRVRLSMKEVDAA